MSERMNDALLEMIHECVHVSLAASLAMVVESMPPGERMAEMSMERMLGPLALGMFHQGIMFALSRPLPAKAYDEMLRAGMHLDADDVREITEDLGNLEAAWRPVQ